MNRKRKRISDYSQRHRRNLINDKVDNIRRLEISEEDSFDVDSSISSNSLTSPENISTDNALTNVESSSEISTCRSNAGTVSEIHLSDVNNVDEELSHYETASLAESDDYRYSSSDMSDVSNLTADDISDDSSDGDDYFYDEEKEAKTEFINDIKEVTLRNNLSHVATKGLLGVLRKHTNTAFPKDHRTLLGTPTKTTVLKIDGGDYYHFGVQVALTKIINNFKINRIVYTNNLNLQINIDGAPLHNSTSKGIWPIQCSLSSLKHSYLVGLFYGPGKPANVEEFLRNFVDEVKLLIENGFTYMDEKFEVSFHALVCDVPAKAMLLNVKGHTGYYSCTSCREVGQRINNVTCFPTEVPIILRTDHEFSQLLYLNTHQKGPSILSEIPNFGMISNVPRDYMHLICLGVTRKLLFLWIYGPEENRLTQNQILLISDRLETLFKYMPTDFARRPRSLTFIKQWKATECRQFLVYSGPIALKDIVPDDIYTNFLYLHIAARILTNRDRIKDPESLRLAENFLTQFVDGFTEIYGPRYVSHNIHNLLHVCMDVERFGVLDDYSAFKFESFIFFLKKLLRKHNQELQKIVRRYAELGKACIDINKKKENTFLGLKNCHKSGPIVPNLGQGKQYKFYATEYFTINCDDIRNNTVILNNKTAVRCYNFIQTENSTFILGKKFMFNAEIFQNPLTSLEVDCFMATESNELNSWETTEIKTKACVIPLENHYAILSMQHYN